MKSTKAKSAAGIVIGVISWYIVTIGLVILLSPLLSDIFGVGSIAIKNWLLFGSLLIFIGLGMYITNGSETKNLLKWLIGGFLLWGMVAMPLAVLLSVKKIALSPDNIYYSNLFIGCIIIFGILIYRSYKERQQIKVSR